MREIAVRTIEKVRDDSEQQPNSTLMTPDVDALATRIREASCSLAAEHDLACSLRAPAAVVEGGGVFVDDSQHLVHTQIRDAEGDVVPLATILAETDQKTRAEFGAVDDARLPLLQVRNGGFDPYYHLVACHADVFGERLHSGDAHEAAVLALVALGGFLFGGGIGVELEGLLESGPVDRGGVAESLVFEEFDGAGEFGCVGGGGAGLLVLRGAGGGGAVFVVAVVLDEGTARAGGGLVGLGLLDFASFCLVGLGALRRREGGLIAHVAVGKQQSAQSLLLRWMTRHGCCVHDDA